jgi:drug/metabolite transporter (DMT)-like permease
MITIFLGFALFASAFTVNKLILGHLSPVFFVGLRTLPAGLIIMVTHAWRTRKPQLCTLRKDWLFLLLIGALTTFLPSVLKNYGLKYLVSSKSALLGSLDPFVTAIYAYFLWKEKLRLRQIVGMFIGFSGVAVLIYSTSALEETLGVFMGIFSWPELAALASMVISRFGWILAQGLLKSERYQPSEINGIIMVTGGTMAFITSFFWNQCDFCAIPLTWGFLGLYTYSVVMGNILGYTIYTYLLKHYNMTLISLCGLSVPLFTHLFGPIIGEPLSLNFFISLALVTLGMTLFMVDPRKLPAHFFAYREARRQRK